MKRAAIIAAYQTVFSSFNRFAFHELYPGREYHRTKALTVIADRLEQCQRGDLKRLIVNLPPRSLKSHTASVAWPLFVLAHNPGLQIRVFAGNQALSAELHASRRKLLQSPRFRFLFPHMGFREGSREFRFGSGGRLVQGTIGFSPIGQGAEVVIIDDPISPSHALNTRHRKHVNEWCSSEIFTRLNDKKDARLILLMQRLHDEDLTAHLIASGQPCEHIVFPAIAETAQAWTLSNQRVVERPAGELFCPEREDKVTLRALLFDMGGKNFLAQYQQSPLAANEPEFRIIFEEGLVDDDWTPDQAYPGSCFMHYSQAELVDRRLFSQPVTAMSKPKRRLTPQEWEQAAMIQQERLIKETADWSERYG